MDFKVHFVAVSVCCCLAQIYGANILTVMPLPFISHFKSFQPLLEELVLRGHNLTLVSMFPLNSRFQLKFKWIDAQKYNTKGPGDIISRVLSNTKIGNIFYCYEFSTEWSEKLLNSSEVQEIIQSDDHYDLVMVEFFCADAFIAFGLKLNAPVISLTSQSLLSTHNWIISNPFPSSYVPNTFTSFTEKMSIISRIINAGFNLITVLHYEFVSSPKIQNLIEKYFHFDKGNVPQIKSIVKNVSVHLVNAHHSFEYLKPLIPKVVFIAGIHFTPPSNLPKNVQKFMDEAENGVIYLSLGSIVTPGSSKDVGEALIRVLENHSHRVLMKWDKKLLSHVPKNILVDEWFPQIDILHHPKCELFITHGGLLSLLESINASVPLLGVPVFADQFHNVAMVEYFEIGMAMDLKEISSTMSIKIEQILHNPKYKQNIIKRSQLFRERLVNPLQEALFWIDHVIKHKDTSHLTMATSQLLWYQLYSVDVIAILIFLLLSTAFVVKFIFLWIRTKLYLIKNEICLRSKKGMTESRKMD